MTSIQAIIVATAVLHNIATFFGLRVPRVTKEEEKDIKKSMIPTVPVAEPGNEGFNLNEIRRNQLIRYFRTRDNVVNTQN